jgi:hypothetical protein
MTTANKYVNVDVEQSRTPLQQANVSGEAENTGQFQNRLKALELPVFYGNKEKFKDSWALFICLVDKKF